MFVVLVYVRVKSGSVKAFEEATLENARNSIQESGIARFDVIQQRDNPERFVLLEAYRSEAAAAEHKNTEHYKKWRETVANMMAQDRRSMKYENVFPDDQDW